ncbi:Na+/H+ antiporter subunit A [Myceligenerans xiligouense]|uniref:Multisubunit sodium/proton antiporter MrpA subunit /multisubunit sodium/proton antiporter MrpB subunit n=1 Tax=Myceligenerans xiligouense TaxID=253184 RepID=A0A3N4ZR28_9MICO|nr:Na+/H+ antiporter subunit A [Myceligenerans xiligouense]RPF23405.1 multisubunit sodium/proton antiporter MrpA subunit /multisubunit sodium/proton antiporter MrpB subunit [Myceligenerans xiligouense]
MLAVLLAHALVALAAPALVARLGRRAFWVLALAPATAAAYALYQTGDILAGRAPAEHLPWIPALGIAVDLRLDTLSWMMLLVVGSVGTLVLLYCSSYFARDAHGLGRFGGFLVAFAGSMAGLVVADDMLVLLVFWELTAVFSYLLIGHYMDRTSSRRAAMQAMIVTTAGGLAMLVGVVVLGVTAGTWSVSAIVAAPPSGPAVTIAVLCLLAGAATKSALVPTHFWLPAAMAAPTPVSAYLHAAAMVKAGVYLVARFAPAFSDLVAWRAVVLALGGTTLLLGGYRALRQHDLKLILAFGTVSQLGLLTLLLGYGTRAAALAGLALLGAHAMFKASLFLVVGIVDAATGTRDLRRLAGVGRRLPLTALAAALATASMIGLPPFAGYVAKEAALEAWTHGGGTLAMVTTGVVAVGSALTVAYGLRFLWGAFKPRLSSPPGPPGPDTATAGRHDIVPVPAHPQPFWMVAPPFLLAVLGLVVALAPGIGERLLAPYADTYPTGEPGHLTLWGGLTPALAVTAAVLLAGALAFLYRDRVERLQDSLWSPVGADVVYRRLTRRLERLAGAVTAGTQRGSLPFYLGVILVALVVGPGLGLAWGLADRPGDTAFPAVSRADGGEILQLGPFTVVPWDRPAQLAVVLVVAVAAVLTANARRRLKAVILVGVAGYGNAALFVLHGAPDLALTQVLAETLILIVMILVLRRLPPYFSDRPLAASRWVRLAIGVATGLVVMMLVAVAPLARRHLPVSVDFPEEAETFGGGHNVVNVTLVDIRAWDTVGEISVLLVAATGVASLVFLRQSRSDALRLDRAAALQAVERPPRTGAQPEQRREWLLTGPTLEPGQRSVLFEVLTRIMFHPMILFALFLLFSGHNAPGGGFAAGLVTGLALTIRYLAGGRFELGAAAPVHPGLVLGTGLFLSAGVGLAALLAGQAALESTIVDLHLPVLGDVHLVTSLFFDIGVFLLVVGLVIDILRSFGAELDRQAETGSRSPEPSERTATTGGDPV